MTDCSACCICEQKNILIIQDHPIPSGVAFQIMTHLFYNSNAPMIYNFDSKILSGLKYSIGEISFNLFFPLLF